MAEGNEYRPFHQRDCQSTPPWLALLVQRGDEEGPTAHTGISHANVDIVDSTRPTFSSLLEKAFAKLGLAPPPSAEEGEDEEAFFSRSVCSGANGKKAAAFIIAMGHWRRNKTPLNSMKDQPTHRGLTEKHWRDLLATAVSNEVRLGHTLVQESLGAWLQSRLSGATDDTMTALGHITMIASRFQPEDSFRLHALWSDFKILADNSADLQKAKARFEDVVRPLVEKSIFGRLLEDPSPDLPSLVLVDAPGSLLFGWVGISAIYVCRSAAVGVALQKDLEIAQKDLEIAELRGLLSQEAPRASFPNSVADPAGRQSAIESAMEGCVLFIALHELTHWYARHLTGDANLHTPDKKYSGAEGKVIEEFGNAFEEEVCGDVVAHFSCHLEFGELFQSFLGFEGEEAKRLAIGELKEWVRRSNSRLPFVSGATGGSGARFMQRPPPMLK